MAERSRAVPPPFSWNDALVSTEDAYGRAAQLVGKTLPASIPLPAVVG
jgi:hypothetical protein